eukprot:12423829-Karenia_brevis.AAC.1
MKLVHTLKQCSPSYYSDAHKYSSSHIDHIAVPACLVELVDIAPQHGPRVEEKYSCHRITDSWIMPPGS